MAVKVFKLCLYTGDKNQARYVNYRDSKLTRILKEALGGNCKTVMIAHVSPASLHFEESRNTLVYADRAKNLKTKVSENDLEFFSQFLDEKDCGLEIFSRFFDNSQHQIKPSSFHHIVECTSCLYQIHCNVVKSSLSILNQISRNVKLFHYFLTIVIVIVLVFSIIWSPDSH